MAEAKEHWWQAPQLELGLVFVLLLAFFAYLQPPLALADPDSFYHARMATMLRDQELVREFPWTQESLYKTLFIDHHLGYHLVLLPFVSLWSNELAGLKVATVFLAACSVTALAWLLRRWRVPWWGAWVALTLTAAPFVFRLSLAKAPSLAVGMALVGYYLIAERKLGWLVLYSWLFVWTYSAWPLLIVLAGLYVIGEASLDLTKGWRAFVHTLFAGRNWQLAAAIVGGYALGLLTNPYFPTNILYLKQLFAMALTPYEKIIGIGAEWYPYNPFDLPQYLAFQLLAWLVATVAGVFTLKKQTALSRGNWITALVFLVYTFRARRQAEYGVPWLVLSAALMLRDAGLASWRPGKLWAEFSTWLPNWLKRRSAYAVLGLYFAVTLPLGMAYAVQAAYLGLRSNLTSTSLQGVAEWLRANAPPRAVVFQTDWGTFPSLWYHNQLSYYQTGLDQTFMYEANHERYWLWQATTAGERRQVYDIAHGTFQASYLIVEKDFPAILKWVARDRRLVKVFEDPEAIVYSLP